MEDEPKCPLCRTRLTDTQPQGTGTASEYDCTRCGRFALGGSAWAELPNYMEKDRNLGYMLSHAIRSMQSDLRPLVNHELLDRIANSGRLPSPAEQAENLLLWLGSHLASPGEQIRIHDSTLGGIVGAAGEQNFFWVNKHLVDVGLLEGGHSFGGSLVTLSFAGWQAVRQLQRGGSTRRVAFMAMPYGNPTLDRVVATAFSPAVEDTGFKLERLDADPSAGLIDNRMRVQIRTSRFLIADLTNGNPGAYWEGGFAEGLGKPVIYTCEKHVFDAKKTHFDTNHSLTIPWEESDLADAKERLKATIRATLPMEAKLLD